MPITPQVCFAFCTMIPGAQFFSVVNGRDRFCALHSLIQTSGYDYEHNTVSEDDSGKFGGLPASVYSTHVCLNASPPKCLQRPPLVDLTKGFPSFAHGKTSTRCGNQVLSKSDAGYEISKCDVESEEEYSVKNNTSQGQPLVTDVGLVCSPRRSRASFLRRASCRLKDHRGAGNTLNDTSCRRTNNFLAPKLVCSSLVRTPSPVRSLPRRLWSLARSTMRPRTPWSATTSDDCIRFCPSGGLGCRASCIFTCDHAPPRSTTRRVDVRPCTPSFDHQTI